MLRCLCIFVIGVVWCCRGLCQDAGIYEAGITLDGVNYSEPATGSSINNVVITKTAGQQLNLTSAHIKTFRKKALANVCRGYFFYRIYTKGSVAPAYSLIICNLFNTINSPEAIQNQEWFNNSINIDLINGLPEGEYVLDIYYGANTATGTSTNCNDGPNSFIQNISADIIITKPLNAQFTGFDTRSDNEYVYLLWQITDSSELQYFTVEKSNNGVQWQVLKEFERNGSTYFYTDSFPSIGLNYYRIQALGFGKSLSSISRRSYVSRVDNLLTVYPNPVNKNLRFQMTALIRGRYQALVYNTNGVKIAGLTIDHTGKDSYVTIPLPSVMSKGVYRLVLLTRNEFYKQNFLVQ